eukprot:TRINITY_DN4318_c0_g2_i2.p1 TRINITY_DN4318_c0_g2~~TRINITY_DN4318_c0_g2_i2.p1  ORF type:complete len:448 (+),score=33.33 TRINITY_DN4318_c0_g2_i2:57-1400(+)
MLVCVGCLNLPAEWRIHLVSNIEGPVYGTILLWCSLLAINNFTSDHWAEGAILASVVAVMAFGTYLLRISASRPCLHDSIEYACWCLIIFGLCVCTCISEDTVFRHRSLMYSMVFSSTTPILLAMRFRMYVALIGYNMLVNFAALWCITLLHGEDIPSRIYIFVLLHSGLYVMICMLQHALLWKLYAAEEDLSFERQALASLTSMTFDATCWLGTDKDTISSSDDQFDGIFGESMKNRSFSALVPSEEDRSRLGRALNQSHGDDSSFMPVTLLLITVATMSGVSHRVEIYIVRYDVKTKDASAYSKFVDRQFLLGIKLKLDVECLQKDEGRRGDAVLDMPNNDEHLHHAPLKLTVDERVVKSAEDFCSQSAATGRAPSVLSVPRTTVTGRVFKSLTGPGVVRAKLSAMERLVKQEHWFIPSAHLDLCPNSVLGKGGFGVVVKSVVRL